MCSKAKGKLCILVRRVRISLSDQVPIRALEHSTYLVAQQLLKKYRYMGSLHSADSYSVVLAIVRFGFTVNPPNPLCEAPQYT